MLSSMSSIPRIPNLSPEAQQVEERAILRVRRELDALSGNIDSDSECWSVRIWRESCLRITQSLSRPGCALHPLFRGPPPELRREPLRKFSLNVGRGWHYSRLAEQAQARRLLSVPPSERRGLLTNARIISDSNFNSLGSAKTKPNVNRSPL
jgi:hypothetical protein